MPWKCIILFSCHDLVESVQHVTKIIHWKRSASSRSSSSRNPLATASKDDADDSGSDFVKEFCLISGSHSSTLDRLYAWERKLYDEVKVLIQTTLTYLICLKFGGHVGFVNLTFKFIGGFHCYKLIVLFATNERNVC